jgi:hypothetical protein
MPECGICYENYNNLKVLFACKHQVCKSCYPKLIDSAVRRGQIPSCHYCRTEIKEVNENYETEFWLNLNPKEWKTYSITLKNGTEIIRTYKEDDIKPSWRNNDNVMILKRHRQRKKYKQNKD